jgi:hypothetical protein
MSIDNVLKEVEELIHRKCTGLEIFIIGIAFNYGYRRALKDQEKNDARP